MADEKSQIDERRKQIKSMLSKIPASVNNGSWDMAISYKKAVKLAQKHLDSPRAKLIDLIQAFNQLNQFHQIN